MLKLAHKYLPEIKQEKRQRLLAQAEEKSCQQRGCPHRESTCPLSKVTTLVENKKAQLVAMAHDMDPIELVVFLTALCRKIGVPTASSSRGRPGWGTWSTGRPALPSPSHRLTRKTKELWLSLWKPSRPITTTHTVRSATTGEATFWVPSWQLASPS